MDIVDSLMDVRCVLVMPRVYSTGEGEGDIGIRLVGCDDCHTDREKEITGGYVVWYLRAAMGP